jgi:hypothetical protein
VLGGLEHLALKGDFPLVKIAECAIRLLVGSVKRISFMRSPWTFGEAW